MQLLRRHLTARRRERGSEAGTTLVELMVSLGIFAVVLGVVAAAVVQMTSALSKAQATTDTSNEVRKVFDLMDHQVRYADAINSPTQVGSNWYVEFRTTADGDADGYPTCTQWFINGTAGTIAYRTWEVDSSDNVAPSQTIPAFSTPVATHIVVAGETPFTWRAAGNLFPEESAGLLTTRQRLRVRISSNSGAQKRATSHSEVDFSARNSSVSSPTNDANDDNIADQFVCNKGYTRT